jgi:hypothetical protein
MFRHVERKALQIHNLCVVIKATQNLLHSLYAVVTLHGGIDRPPVCGKRETHIHISNTAYVPFPQLFAKGKSLKSEGICMPRDMAIASLGRNWAMPNQKWGIPSVLRTQCPENLFLDYPVIIQ